MGIKVDKEKQLFQINTANTTYLMGVADGRHLGHLYYGKKMEDLDGAYLMRPQPGPAGEHHRFRDKNAFMDSFCFEYPAYGTGDFRDTAARAGRKRLPCM